MPTTWNRLLSADEARSLFRAAWTPVTRTVRLSAEAALNLALSRPIEAPEDLPAFARSLMDGFACRASDLAPGPARLRITGAVEMGSESPLSLAPGGAIRVPTGGWLPSGADVVVPIEQAEVRDGIVCIDSPVAAGRHVIGAGDDIKRGAQLFAAGHVVAPPDVAALLALGITEVDVTPAPCVGILATGDELVPPSETPRGSQIRETNSYALAAACRKLGCSPSRGGIIRDEESELIEVARRMLAANDVLLFSGGTSVGERDVVAAVISSLGAPGVVVHGMNIRPGKPAILAVCDGKPVFGLPGQPISVMNTFDLFVAPVLRALGAHASPERMVKATLTEPIRSADGREDHVRVAIEERSDGVFARPLGGLSAMVTSLARADGVVVIPAAGAGFKAGETVCVRLIR